MRLAREATGRQSSLMHADSRRRNGPHRQADGRASFFRAAPGQRPVSRRRARAAAWMDSIPGCNRGVLTAARLPSRAIYSSTTSCTPLGINPSGRERTPSTALESAANHSPESPENQLRSRSATGVLALASRSRGRVQHSGGCYRMSPQACGYCPCRSKLIWQDRYPGNSCWAHSPGNGATPRADLASGVPLRLRAGATAAARAALRSPPVVPPCEPLPAQYGGSGGPLQADPEALPALALRPKRSNL